MGKINNKNEEIVNIQLNQAIEVLANILVFIIENDTSEDGSISD